MTTVMPEQGQELKRLTEEEMVVFNEKIEKCIVSLILEKPFYAHLLQQMKRTYKHDFPAPAGVAVTDNIDLYLNPELFNRFTQDEKVAVFEHEILHIIDEHPVREMGREHEPWNKACDTAINQYIQKLPEGVCQPDAFGYPRGKHAEYYYDLFEKNNKKGKDGEGEGDGEPTIVEIDFHGEWGKEANTDLAKEILKRAVKKAYEETPEKDMGYLPGDYRHKLDDLMTKKKTVNWRVVLRTFARNATKIFFKDTRMRPNRRLWWSPGKKVEPKLNMIVAVDTSGSIGEQELGLFFGEIDKMYGCGMSIDIIECDADVGTHYKYRGHPPQQVTGGGGTSFVPVFEYIKNKKLKPDCVVYLTDGYGTFPPKNRISTMWVITENGMSLEDIPWGRRLKLKVKPDGE